MSPRSRGRPRGRSYRWAWLSLATYPVSLVLAFVVGEGLLALLGAPGDGEDRPPVWMVLVAGVPALVVLVVPGALAAYLGFRAVREGREAGRWPAWIGIALAGLLVLQNGLAFLLG